jgi:hypothetical protein
MKTEWKICYEMPSILITTTWNAFSQILNIPTEKLSEERIIAIHWHVVRIQSTESDKSLANNFPNYHLDLKLSPPNEI